MAGDTIIVARPATIAARTTTEISFGMVVVAATTSPCSMLRIS